MIDAVIRKAIESRIAAQGLTWLKLRAFELRSAEKYAVVDLELEGEPAPVRVTARYRVEADAVVVEAVECSKKWLTEVLSIALVKHGGRVALPTGIAGAVARMVL